MSKYDSLWKHIQRSGKDSLDLTFDEIAAIAGLPIDHSFLNYKKELLDYGYEVGKISLKNKTVHFKSLGDKLPARSSPCLNLFGVLVLYKVTNRPGSLAPFNTSILSNL